MAGRRKKRVGGVKQPPKPERSCAAPARPVPQRKRVGGVIAEDIPGSPIVQSCPQNCPGEWLYGGDTWIHSAWCEYAPALWKAHGRVRADWKCAWDCEPTELPSAFTHAWDCPFWEKYPTLTPFGPGGTQQEESQDDLPF